MDARQEEQKYIYIGPLAGVQNIAPRVLVNR